MAIEMVNLVTKLRLTESLTIEELYDLMQKAGSDYFPGKFQLKKGLLGKKIEFDTYMKATPTIKVKENTVTIRKVEKSTSVNGVDFKAMAQSVDALSKGDLSSGIDYFPAVVKGMKSLLANRIQG